MSPGNPGDIFLYDSKWLITYLLILISVIFIGIPFLS